MGYPRKSLKRRKKWAEMISYIRTGDFDKALVLFHPYVRKKQAEIFQALKKDWPKLVNEQIDFRRKSIDDKRGFAFYELVTKEKDGTFAHEVNFQKDQNDNWYIVEF